jgi:hypothetical protein
MKVEISVPEVVSIFKEIQDPWIFDKTKRPATHPSGVHHKADYEAAL